MSRTCTVCGKNSDHLPNTRFCSLDCRLQFKRDYEKAYRAAHKKPPPEPERFEPFPPHIDREGFGHWLSGFSAGEATFGLKVCLHRLNVVHQGWFRITLRDDDTETLRLIQSYWNCGLVSFQDNARSKIPNAKPIAVYSIQRVADLVQKVIAHFERYPLYAKKRNDFAVWKRGVELMAEIQGRPQVGRLGGTGIMPSWTDADRATFLSLSLDLKNQRKYIDSSEDI